MVYCDFRIYHTVTSKEGFPISLIDRHSFHKQKTTKPSKILQKNHLTVFDPFCDQHHDEDVS